jgi:hypothetical protein
VLCHYAADGWGRVDRGGSLVSACVGFCVHCVGCTQYFLRLILKKELENNF